MQESIASANGPYFCKMHSSMLAFCTEIVCLNAVECDNAFSQLCKKECVFRCHRFLHQHWLQRVRDAGDSSKLKQRSSEGKPRRAVVSFLVGGRGEAGTYYSTRVRSAAKEVWYAACGCCQYGAVVVMVAAMVLVVHQRFEL